MKGQLFLYITATAVAAWGGITDLKCRKIYNKLTLPAAAAGIGLNGALAGIWGLKNSLLGLALGTSFMALWLMGTLKAGDVKLYMAVGALTGWKFCGYAMIYSVLLGGIAAAWLVISQKRGRRVFGRLKLYLENLWYTKNIKPYEPEDDCGYFSFGCCIFAGAAAALWRMWPV